MFVKTENKQKEAGDVPFLNKERTKSMTWLGGSSGLVVMGDDSCSRGRGFKSRCNLLDGHFFTFICCKNSSVCLKKTNK